jgi:putative molybdopterin biosynthesis protein
MRLLTTTEAAKYLRLKERKIYELVAEGAIPCTKVTGRWLFPQAELDHWLSSSLMRPKGLAPAEPMPIVGGSHDPLLEWALRESSSGLATLPEGSEAGLARFANGTIVAAAIHLHSLADRDDANVDALAKRSNFHDAVLIGFARREQGFLVAPGNPLGIAGIADIIAQRARVAVRPPGAGAQLLLLSLLHRAELSFDAIVIVWERFDVAMRQRNYFRPALQAFLGFLRTETFAMRARELGGYDITDAGAVRHAR